MVEKLKEVRSHTRKTKSGKNVIVRAYKAKYNAAEEEARAAAKKKGAGEEFNEKKHKVASFESQFYDDLGINATDFNQWFEGDGSEADKRVEERMRRFFGEEIYNKISDAAADSYGKGFTHFMHNNLSMISAISYATHSLKFGVTPAEFSEWYERTGSKADKKCEDALRLRLGDAAYMEFSNYATDHYRKDDDKSKMGSAAHLMGVMAYSTTFGKTPKGESIYTDSQFGEIFPKWSARLKQGYDKKAIVGRGTKLKSTPKEKGGSGIPKVGEKVELADWMDTTQKKSSFEVIGVQRARKVDRDADISHWLWVKDSKGEVHAATRSPNGKMGIDSTWTDFTGMKRHPYEKSLKDAGYSLSKAKGYWEIFN